MFGAYSYYRKIPKISPGACISTALFKELIIEGAYLWREISVSKSIGLALHLEGNLLFLLCFALYFRGAYIWRGDLIEGFLRYEFGGLTFGGAYFRNFTVTLKGALSVK